MAEFQRRNTRDRDPRPNEEERAAMNAWRLGFLSREEMAERLGADRFRELLTPRERATMKKEKI